MIYIALILGFIALSQLGDYIDERQNRLEELEDPDRDSPKDALIQRLEDEEGANSYL